MHTKKITKKLLEATDMSTTLIVVMLPQGNTRVQTHQIARFKYMLFLYIYKVVFKKKKEKETPARKCLQEREGCQV